ncbi:hypothetical protein M5X06_22335 [Paenibacillus alvei]|uniref:Uncharacterized protein n=1 Tax=Paenibacillus alvei TaxID=44250 RepID=A0ABT4H3C5_PAEAL|nr:hypothetical protein [Paenibacillus alvei]MCY9763182.1 hypothetical protein [Paenibacillus alvei]MCY9769529.1 hypothetical protein [Paenibacillus alvei]
MAKFQMHYISLGSYNVLFAVEANTNEEANEKAIVEMKKDGIYREGSTELYQINRI